MIKINGLESVTTPAATTIVWDDHGLLGKVFSKVMLSELTERMLCQFGQPTKAFLALWGRLFPQNDIGELKSEFKALEEKYRRLSNYNRRIFPSSELHQVSTAIIVDEWEPQIFSKVTELS